MNIVSDLPCILTKTLKNKQNKYHLEDRHQAFQSLPESLG